MAGRTRSKLQTVLGLPWPSTVNNAETQCGFGGLLASIHSEEVKICFSINIRWTLNSFDPARILQKLHSKWKPNWQPKNIQRSQENEFARTMLCQPGYPEPFKEKIIGLKCTHIGCAWDDGTPVDYKRFGNPTFPGTGCFVIQDQYGTWFPPSWVFIIFFIYIVQIFIFIKSLNCFEQACYELMHLLVNIDACRANCGSQRGCWLCRVKAKSKMKTEQI